MTLPRVIGVVGMGSIGTTVCADLLLHGFDVVAVDVSAVRIEAASELIERAVRFVPMLRPDIRRERSADSAEPTLRASTDPSRLAGVSLVVENIPEIWEEKRALYAKLSEFCCAETIIAANTSSISITALAGVVKNPGRVVGMHFMNPAYLSEGVEIVRGAETSHRTIDQAVAFASALHKEPIVVEDLPGFASNRVSHLFMNEAAWVVQDRVACARDVDRLFKKCFGHRMGPLETADLIGLDTVVLTLEHLWKTYGDSKYRVCPLLRRMVDEGRLGRKSGRGFYDYDAPKGKQEVQ